MRISLQSDGLHVISKNDFWRIIIEEYKGKPILYHRNRHSFRRADTNEIPMYHKQKCNSATLMGHFQYIAKHDAYRDREENGRNVTQANAFRDTRKKKKEGKKQKRKQLRKDVARVMMLIEELSSCQN